jgi:hypothetical protein
MSLLTAWAGREVRAAKRTEAVRMRIEYERGMCGELLKVLWMDFCITRILVARRRRKAASRIAC